MNPVIAITMGDPAGIGTEIIMKALNHESVYQSCLPLVVGDAKMLDRALKLFPNRMSICKIAAIAEAKPEFGVVSCLDLDLLPGDLPFGKVSTVAGEAAYRYIEKAIALAVNHEVDAICTAPINKEAIHRAGHRYPGHTEILASLTGTTDYSMMLSTPKLKVIHLTTHVGLIQAIDMINPERTYKVAKLAHDTLRRAGIMHPKIAVCGINPHAGENGLFGNGEEEEKLVPGIEKAKSEGMDVIGPYPADTLFFRAARGDFDIVVACYHDQGHGPVKVMGIEAGVNITVGLKGGLIRTSVDHGTAYDIAGKGVADERSMLEAIRVAAELAPRSTANRHD